jgi:hypothetical protein
MAMAATKNRNETKAPPAVVFSSPSPPRKPMPVVAMEIDPPTMSITRLRPVSARTEPQIMTTVQASASRPSMMRTPAKAPAKDPKPGIAASRSPVAPPDTAPRTRNARVTRIPNAPKTKLRTAATVTAGGLADTAVRPYCS